MNTFLHLCFNLSEILACIAIVLCLVVVILFLYTIVKELVNEEF